MKAFEIEKEIVCLEELILDDDLGRLEAFTSRFNIFESIGAIRRELRHSDFLSFLLTPGSNHGISESFLKAFLFDITKYNVQTTNRTISVSPIDVDLYDLSDIDVKREWKNIDILLISKKNQFVCAIENKVDSDESKSQLTDYRKKVENEFPDYKKLYIYLTLEGQEAKSLEDRDYWLPYSYGNIHALLNTILKKSVGNIGEDIYILLKHYSEMINRHLMADSDIAKLSKEIYKRHKQALDLIFEHKPDMQSEIQEYLMGEIRDNRNGKIELDQSTKNLIRFAVSKWDNFEGQKSGEGQWTKNNRVLLFEFQNSQNELVLKLIIGPGQQEFRENIFNEINRDPTPVPFKINKSLGTKWTQIYRRQIVDKKQMMEEDFESLKKIINAKLEEFFKQDKHFDEICAFIEKIF